MKSTCFISDIHLIRGVASGALPVLANRGREGDKCMKNNGFYNFLGIHSTAVRQSEAVSFVFYIFRYPYCRRVSATDTGPAIMASFVPFSLSYTVLFQTPCCPSHTNRNGFISFRNTNTGHHSVIHQNKTFLLSYYYVHRVIYDVSCERCICPNRYRYCIRQPVVSSSTYMATPRPHDQPTTVTRFVPGRAGHVRRPFNPWFYLLPSTDPFSKG